MSRNAPRHATPSPPRPSWGQSLLESRRVLVVLVMISVIVTVIALALGVATAAAPQAYGL